LKSSGNIAGSGLLLAALLFASGAAAQTAAAPAKAPQSPLSFTLAYTADLLADVSGGADPGGGHAQLIKVTAAYDGAKGGRAGLTARVSLISENGSDFTARRVGGFQAVSASEARPAATRLYEAWVQQEIGPAGVKIGLVDLNATFDVQRTAALFLNASQGIGPDIGDTGVNGPSDYPTPAPAVTLVYRPAAGWTARLGVFDAIAGDPAHRSAFVGVEFGGGALIIGQVEKRFGDAARFYVGAWTYTAAFPSLDQLDAAGRPRQVHGNSGLYALVDGLLLAKPGKSGEGLRGWIRAGVANGDINLAENYLGAGLVYTGPFSGRDQDQIGVAIARAGFGAGARYQGALAGRDIGPAETDIETTYHYALKDWVSLQPDVQYVINPSGDRHIPNALVVGFRLAITASR
jgi:porin